MNETTYYTTSNEIETENVSPPPDNMETVLSEMGIPCTNTTQYVNNKELYEHIVKYCEKRDKAIAEGRDKPVIDDYIASAIMKIAVHLSFRPNFIGYSYKQDMIGDAIENCLIYFDSFDPKKSKNAFSYITQICWSSFLRRLKIEKKQSIIKGKLMMQTIKQQNDEETLNVQSNNNVVHTYIKLAEEEETKKHIQRQLNKQNRLKENTLMQLFKED